MLGLFGSNQVAAIGSIAMVLGGIVSLGSNVSTLRQSAALISRIGGSVLKSRHNLRAARAFTMSFRTPYLWNGTTKKR
jgi:hypothetical protein